MNKSTMLPLGGISEKSVGIEGRYIAQSIGHDVKPCIDPPFWGPISCGLGAIEVRSFIDLLGHPKMRIKMTLKWSDTAPKDLLG